MPSLNILSRVAASVNNLPNIPPKAVKRVPVFNRGVSILFLRTLLSELRASNREHVSPGQLVWGATTPGPRNYMFFDSKSDPLSLAAITKRTALSFVETSIQHLSNEGDDDHVDVTDYFGSSTIFVSYGWHGAIVSEQIESLLEEFSGVGDGDDTTHYFWIDIFAVAQNQTTPVEKENNQNDVYSFEDVVRHTNSTLLYWAPYATPNPVRRVWCLYEILLTCRQGNPLEVFFRGDDLRAMQSLPPIELALESRRALDDIRSVEAAATFQNDWDRIHVQIEATLSPHSKRKWNREKHLIAPVKHADPDYWEEIDGTWMFERWNIWFMFGGWEEETGRGAWGGSALGHRELDRLASAAVAKALEKKKVPVASGARLIQELVDVVDEEPRQEGGICHAGSFLACMWGTQNEGEGRSVVGEEKMEEKTVHSPNEWDDDDDDESSEEESDEPPVSYATRIYDTRTGELVQTLTSHDHPLDKFVDLNSSPTSRGGDSLVASTSRPSQRASRAERFGGVGTTGELPGEDSVLAPILIWRMETGEQVGSLNLEAALVPREEDKEDRGSSSKQQDGNDDDGGGGGGGGSGGGGGGSGGAVLSKKKKKRLKKKRQQQRKKKLKRKQVSSILLLTRAASSLEPAVVVHHDDDSLSVWDVRSCKMLSTTESGVASAPILTLCLPDDSSLVLSNMSVPSRPRTPPDDETNTVAGIHSMAIWKWDDAGGALDRVRLLEFPDCGGGSSGNGVEHVCDVGRGEVAGVSCCDDSNEGKVGEPHLIQVWSAVDGRHLRTSLPTEIDIMLMVGCPEGRMLALCDLYGAEVWSSVGLVRLMRFPKGDFTMECKVSVSDETGVATLMASDQRGCLSWWEFESVEERADGEDDDVGKNNKCRK